MIDDIYTMNTGEDESSSGLNGRLRPRKSVVSSPQNNKIVRKSDGKSSQDRPKRTSTPLKASPKPDDLPNKSDSSTALQLLCPYCDRKFASKQAVSKHVRRIHFSSSKQNFVFECLFCKHAAPDSNDIIRHMVDSHPNQYFACLDCHTRFISTSELAEHKLNVCEKQKMSYRNKLRQKTSSGTKKNQKSINIDAKDIKDYSNQNRFNGVVISCELKPSQVTDNADIEDNITTNLILPPSKSLGSNAEIEKNAVIVLDDLQWNKRMPANFSFHNTDADQILSRLGVVHRSPRNSEFAKKDWFKTIDESTQKFEKCFDTGFYSKVASNVQENLSKFLDGSFNFNPDADSTIKTRKLKNSVVINTAEGFPILLAGDQFSRTAFDGYIPRTIAPKHKWKWDNEKNPMNLADIKRDSHVNNCIITLVSSLDIWTQLCMRRKFEDKFSIVPLEKKTEKQNAISKELKEILESREIPATSSHVVKLSSKPMPFGDSLDFPASLGLRPSAPSYDLQPAVLSGEWVRPRCYVCCACGAQTRDSRALSSHITTHHPNAQVQHYEIVGELLLNADILKHLYVPPSLLSNRTRPLRGFRECTKCKKSISLEDLHQHMLDCAGDTPTVRRKCRYRPFGVRRRRPRLPDNTIRKKIRKDIRRQTRQTRQKTLMRPRPKIRTEVGDAESIRKMIADLPAKRHRVMVTPTNPILRPRKKLDQQRNKLILKRRSTEISKTRKQNDNNRNVDNRGRLVASHEDNDDKSNKDDDEKPLKPRLKRIMAKKTRQNETMKRKVALSRAKRRAHLKQATVTEVTEPSNVEHPPSETVAASGSTVIEQLSVGNNTPQKIDVNNSPYNTREHSSRNRSNNNDQQRPGRGEQNGNINDSFMPSPNEPLKHSIARLTSDTDMYDKSLQLHHQMFLLQQECNSFSQHVPVGQQRLFENEAVVTKLDKPPLHFEQRGMLDPFAFQRNKLNKPRKGLNDCIAMLKNKLVEPILTTQTSHSVESGSDDSLISQSATVNQPHSGADFQMPINTRPAEIFSRHNFIQDRFLQLRNDSNLIHQSFADMPLHFLPVQTLYELPRRGNKIEKNKPPKQKTHSGAKRESARRRSSRSDKDNMRNKSFVLPPHIELIPHNPNETYAAKVSPPCKLDSVHIQNIENNANDKYKRKTNQSGVPPALRQKKGHDSAQLSLEIKSQSVSKELLDKRLTEVNTLSHLKHAKTSVQSPIKQIESSAQSQAKNIDAYTDAQHKQFDTFSNLKARQTDSFLQPQIKQTDSYIQPQLKPTDSYTPSQMKQAETITPSQMKQVDTYTPSHLKQVETYAPAQLKQDEVYTKSQLKQTECYPQSQSSKTQQPMAYTETNFNKNMTESFHEPEVPRLIMSHEIYPETNFNSVEMSLIRTNSDSSNLDAVLPVPLDLTVNITDNSQTSKQNSSYDLNDYDSYETLDLSNKSTEIVGEDLVVDDVNDGIVDLRVKSCEKSQEELELSGKNSAMESATDLTIKTLEMDNVPTDLTVKKKTDVYEYDYNCVQDLSKHSINNCDKSDKILTIIEDNLDQDIPTDLSGKKPVEVSSNLTMISKISCNTKDPLSINEKTNNTGPADLSGRKELDKQVNHQEKSIRQDEALIAAENSELEIDVEKSQDSYDLNEMHSYNLKGQEHYKTIDLQAYTGTDALFVTNKRFDIPITDSLYVKDPTITTASEMFDVDVIQTGSSDNTSAKTNVKNFTQPHENSESPSICLSDTPIPLYTMSNTTPISSSKYESTMPVYTLANACISMSKVEPTSRVSNMDLSFRFPEKATDNNAQNCTLLDASDRQDNYSTLKDSNQHQKTPLTKSTEPSKKAVNCEEGNTEAQNTISHIISTPVSLTSTVDSQAKANILSSQGIETDPETAKKIALLPKELVEILGTMPEDHRNQLLNVLPHYVSKSPSPVVQPKDSSVAPVSLCTAVETSTLTCQSSVSSHFTDVEQTRNDDTKPFAHKYEKHEIPAVEFEIYNAIVSKAPEKDRNRIIDLTEDEPPFDTKVKKNTEECNSNISISSEPPVIKSSSKPKVNDQTASLRAVRIKTPSERNKSMSMENQLQKANQIKINVQNSQDLQPAIEKSSDIDKTMAIQQAEVSSTQHNTTSSGKYPLAISPASTESSSDEASKNIIQKMPVIAVSAVTDKMEEQVYNIPVPKTSNVSSSVSTKESNEFHTGTLLNTDKKNDSLLVSPIECEPQLSSTNKAFKLIADKSTDGNILTETEKTNLKRDLKILEPDDSEDDISLATIVKQKQLDQKKTEELIEKQDTGCGSKKKRFKKTKRCRRRVSIRTADVSTSNKTIEVQSNRTSSLNIEINTESQLLCRENCVTNQETKIETAIVVSKEQEELGSNSQKSETGDIHSKSLPECDIKCDETKRVNNRNNESAPHDQKTSKPFENIPSQEIYLTNITDEPCESNKEVMKDGKITSDTLKKKGKSKKKIIKSNLTIKLNKIESITSVSLDVLTNERNKLQTPVQVDATTSIETGDCVQGVEKLDAKRSSKTNDNVTTSTALTSNMMDDVSDAPLDVAQNVHDNFTEASTELRKDKDLNVKKNKSVEIHINQDEHFVENTDSKVNFVKPLRRSRRGKSLFMESTVLEKDTLSSSELSNEQKTPLTKKQLIFSKLLLDEGKPETHLSGLNEVDMCKDKDFLTNEVVPDSNNKDISNTEIHNIKDTLERNKATKRRFSPNCSKKSKKKKSIDDCQSDINDSIETETCNNSNLVDSVSDLNSSCTESTLLSSKDIKESENTVKEKESTEKNISDELVVNSSEDVSGCSKNSEKSPLSTEKRKISNELSFDIIRSSRPKKSKTTKSDKLHEAPVVKVVEQPGNKDIKTDDFVDGPIPGSRTACYNIPVPARRGRSKSVVVKSSSTDLYDPYDIDLEDMIEQHEYFRRKKKSSEPKPNTSQKKCKPCSVVAKEISKSPPEKESSKEVVHCEDQNKSPMSDSDESSKSDVPLQKYIAEREKKNNESEASSFQKKSECEKPSDYQINEGSKVNKSIELGSGDAITENEAEETLRSEQFMESFGFFSERKPRKSNLLATKKISETFHINNESDDLYFGFKERSAKKNLQSDKDNKKSNDSEVSNTNLSKKAAKRGRKKKSCTKILPSYCSVCKKEFRRPDNYLRHQMTLLHISKLSEVEMKVKTAPVHEEPNYLMAYKQYLERFQKLTDKLSKLKKKNPKAAAKIVLPTMQEILSDVNRAVREQQLSQRGLSRDEELFIDCCELLKESHNVDKPNMSGTTNPSMSGLDILENAINTSFSNECESDDDVDSITAQNILDSEEVRNLENDLISGLKEAANATRKSCNIDYQTPGKLITESVSHVHNFASSSETESNYQMVGFDMPEKQKSNKTKKHCTSTEFIQIKEKMYPDVIEDIDMFEDKFDKIKRKCRSQAAAAKQTPPIVEKSASQKIRRKSEKRKGKRSSKKTKHQSTQVPTKGALKGFDGIKVSIPTSDINLPSLVPVAESSPKKKKKNSSKKKRDKKDSESSGKYDSDHRGKDSTVGHSKKLDVYEFMDNEDAELFEFRPSTLMERFKSMSNKEMPSTSKLTSAALEENSSESGSDGDDFVYMSDDYVCSDDETENSLLSCDNANVKLSIDIKKNVSPQKRKDVVEKNAVMGKIFKHNAVRSEKKITAPKESIKPKANLDQLFDSLLEEEPSTSMLNNELNSPKKDENLSLKKHTTTTLEYDSNSANDFDSSDDDNVSSSKIFDPNLPDKPEYIAASTSKRRTSSTSSKECIKDPQKVESLSKKYTTEIEYKSAIDSGIISTLDYDSNSSKKYDSQLDTEKDYKSDLSPTIYESVSVKKNEQSLDKHCEVKLSKQNEASTSKHDELVKSYDDSKLSSKKSDQFVSTSHEHAEDVYDETGVARQRARRKCTVGKQNVLAESWSSESEPDGGPPRPNSAESVVAVSGRRKKGRKKDGQQAGGRRGNSRQLAFKRYDIESRVNSSNRSRSSDGTGSGHSNTADDGARPGLSGIGKGSIVASPSSSVAVASASAAEAAAAAAAAMPAPSTSQAPGAAGQKGRPRSVAYYWSSEGDDEQEHQQQHGWIVGDSHKKLVTMLAHAKGRKRNSDDKRHLVE
ncbi:unnamed protein product [Chilo suppressalis]|uniref:C2H2-type domain-containing protein n=1 Tax=Chilo suppressalis TaxID=168631 RepID=A0ABN8AZW8_CHISP|nr:unnamed protein product [Chilo suppressalis]